MNELNARNLSLSVFVTYLASRDIVESTVFLSGKIIKLKKYSPFSNEIFNEIPIIEVFHQYL